jgi:hypothetical protein
MKLASEHLEILKTMLEKLASGEGAFVPRREMKPNVQDSDYDHLSRFAEWDAA